MELIKSNICPKCGGKIVAEYFGLYGTIYYLRKDGTLGHEIKNIKYEHTGDYLYYCSNCGETMDEGVRR